MSFCLHIIPSKASIKQRHTFCSRLLLAVIPSVMYVKDLTLQTILSGVVEDLKQLETEGIQAPLQRL